MASPANNPFGVPPGNPFGAPGQNPFGAPSSNPFGGSSFGAAAAAPPQSTPSFGSQPAQNQFGGGFGAAPSSFGSQPAAGFGVPTSFGSSDGNNMARRGKGKMLALNASNGPQDKGGKSNQFGAQSNKDTRRTNLFQGPKGSSLKREVAKVAAPAASVPSSQRKRNERPNGSQPPTQHSRRGKQGATQGPSEATRQLSPFAYDYANKLYDHLKKEGIKAPTWPAQVGNPDKRGAVETLKESYKKYRTRAYASLRKADLIDDPDKRRRLEDALPFKGICEDMCPEFEQVSRIAEYDVKTEEKDERGWPDTAKMVKKFGRSAAGQDAPLPMDVRSVAALRRSTDYLFNELLQSENNLASMHNYLRDRTRAVRKDFTFHSKKTNEEMKELVYCFETITRFHATALHLLCRKGHSYESFDSRQEIEQLGRTLLSLIEAYDKCRKKGVVCENEPEFRAYYLLLNAHDPSIMKRILTWGKEYWFQSEEVQTALALIQVMDDIRETKGPLKPKRPVTLSDTSFANFFAIVEDSRTSYTMACIAEVHFTWVRQNILKNFVRGYSRHRDAPRTITAANLNKLLRFDTDEEAVEFIELHGFEMSTWVPPNRPPVTEPYLLLNNKKKVVPSPRVPQAFSGKLVERKRTTQSLPYVIYNTIYEGSTEGDVGMEDELFVTQNNTLGASSAFGQLASQPAAATSSFGFGSLANGVPAQPQAPASAFGSSNTPSGVTPGFGAPAPSASPFGQPPPQANNPFGQPTAPTATATVPAPTPFASFGSNPTPAPAPTPAQPPSQKEAGKSSFSFGTPQTAIFGSGAPPPSLAEPSAPSFGFTKPPEPAALAPTPFSFLNKDASPAQPASVLSSTEKAPIFGNNAAPTASTQPTRAPASGFSLAQPTQPTSSLTFPGLGAKPESPKNVQPAPAAPAQQPAVPSVSITQPTPTSGVFPPQQPVQPAPAQSQFPAPTPPAVPPPVQNAPLFTVTPSAPQAPPPTPKRDLMAGFTKWYVTGDGGLMEQFAENTVQNLVWDVFQRYQLEEAERVRREEDEESWRAAREFMCYRLGHKYFNRWRETARRLSMRRRLREGKRLMREWRVMQKEREREKEQEEKERVKERKRKAEEDVRLLERLVKGSGRGWGGGSVDGVFSHDGDGGQEEELTRRSGMFGDVVGNEGELVKRAVMGGFGVTTGTGTGYEGYEGYEESELELVPAPKEMTAGSPDSDATAQREGWKTRSLRERFVSDHGRRSVSAHSSINGRASLRSTNFSGVNNNNNKKRRSAELDGLLREPDAKRQSIAMSTTSCGSNASASRPGIRSRHWEMRLRGFVQGADGGWVAESLANSSGNDGQSQRPPPLTELEIRLARIRRDHSVGRGGSRSRGASQSGGMGMSPPPPPPPLWGEGVGKRKRDGEGEEDRGRQGGEFSPSERERGRGRSGAGTTTTKDMVEDTQRMLRELRETMELLERDRLVLPGGEGETTEGWVA
ncbi:actin cytoskeleton and mitosis protein [Podospora bellae-mahoneyi]|uniref:Actin cytoskeleton and mitosis protein n=1 Tax=Podospora bellae-mahoneyi TaxID=2093777 RepID=A0ABR0FS54_9PEZI|nr:actin cytoskeleton and mitosis protein [Podospora bellae-mahoneyi]